jgi:hypothetical protein
MWKDKDPVRVPLRNYSLLANLAFYGYDDGYTFVTFCTTFFTLLDAGLIWFTWKPFQKFYELKKADRD